MKTLKVLPLLLLALTASAEEMTAELSTPIEDIVAAGKATPVDGLTSTGQPDAVALKILAESGYVAVIDLRTAGEDRGMDDEEAAVKAEGMQYISLPVDSASGITFENSSKLEQYLASFDGPVVVHCGSGNRVGALLALRQSQKGDDDETAIAYGKKGGLTRLEPRVREVLEAD